MVDLTKNQMSPTGSLLSVGTPALGGSFTLSEQTPEEEDTVIPMPTGIEAEAPEVTNEPMAQVEDPINTPVVEDTISDPVVEDMTELPQDPEDLFTLEQEFSNVFSPEDDVEEDSWGGVSVAPDVIEGADMPNLGALGIEAVDNRVIDDDWGIEGISVTPDAPLDMAKLKAEKHVSDIVGVANKVAYRGVKGLADTIDFISVPVWAITSTIGLTGRKPFASTLEEYYPEKSYIIEENPDSYADDMLRIAGTGLEFAVGGLGTAAAVKGGAKVSTMLAPSSTKVIDDIATSAEVKLGVLSGVGYQTTLEYTDSEIAAFAAAILAPVASKPVEVIMRAGWEGTKTTAKISLAPVTWVGNKIYNFSPAMQVINPKAQISSLKVQLAGDDDMWRTGFGGVARKLIEKVPDSKVSNIEEQIKELDNLRDWIGKSIPKGERVNSHVAKMKDMEDSLNKWASGKDLGEFKLTLDQLYRPLLKDMNDTEGFEELLEVGKLLGAEAHSNQVRKNTDILYKFLADESVPVELKQSGYFQGVFKAQSDELDELSQTIVDQAISAELFDRSSGAYDAAYESMPAVISGLNKVLKLHQESYGAWKATIPEMDLDVTPITNAFEDLASTTGLFDNPANTPPYLRQMVSDLESLGTKRINRDGQLNASNNLDIQLKDLAKERRDMQLKHIRENESTEGTKVDLVGQHKEELNVLDDRRTELNNQKSQLSMDKRDSKGTTDGLRSVPNPSFTSIADVLQAHKILSDLKYKSLKAGDDKYTTIKPILDSVDETLEGLLEIDPAVYANWKGFKSNYRKLVGVQMRETIADKAMGPDGRHYKLSSGRAVDAFFENAKADEIQDFLKVFDPSVSGLNEWLGIIPEQTEVGISGLRQVVSKSGADQFTDISTEATEAYKDMIYSSLAREVTSSAEGTMKLDPVKRLEAIDKVVLDWMQKNQDKLKIIPDLELTPTNLQGTRETLGSYIEMLKVVEEQRKLAMFNNIQGPGVTIQNALNDDVKAQQLADFLEDTLPALPYPGKSPIGLETSNNVRMLMHNALLRDYMDGDLLDYKALGSILGEGTTSRNNLIRIFESSTVEKLDAQVALHKAISESEVTLTEAINSDKVIKGLGKIGISLGRVGSLLQRRAVFQPSAGYLAGAAMTKLINIAGKNQTSKTLSIFMDNPSALVEFDNILLKAKADLSPSKQARMDAVLSDPERNIKELYPMLKDLYFGKAKGYFGYLGIKFTDEEIQGAIKEVFFPPVPEEPQEPTEVNPVVQEIDKE
jgi:hypothetical protein